MMAKIKREGKNMVYVIGVATGIMIGALILVMAAIIKHYFG